MTPPSPRKRIASAAKFAFIENIGLRRRAAARLAQSGVVNEFVRYADVPPHRVGSTGDGADGGQDAIPAAAG